MIEAKPGSAFRMLAERLTQRARTLADIRANQLRAAQHIDGREWRDARLLWPFFSRN